MSIKNKLLFIIPITLTGIMIFNNKQKYLTNIYSSTSCGLTVSTISKILIQSNSKYNDSIFVTNVYSLIDLDQILNSNDEGFFNITLYSTLTSKSMNSKIYNHTMIIQKISQDKYKIYQSFLNYYSLNEYLTFNDGILNKKEIINVFKELYDLQMLNDEENKTLVKKHLLFEEHNFDNFFCYKIITDFISYEKISDISIKYENKTFLEKINSQSINLQNQYMNQYFCDINDNKNKFILAVFIGLFLFII